MQSKKITYIALMCGVAIVLSIMENVLLGFTTVLPGIKPGLANVAVLVCLKLYGWRWATLVALVKICATFFATGAVTVLLYSLAGGLLSFVVMVIIFNNTKRFTLAGISSAGGVMSNVAQIAVMIALTSTFEFVYYLPVLVISGAAFGLIMGMVANAVTAKLPTKSR